MTRHMLERGDAVPHFTVHTTTGTKVAYAAIWQQKHLLLIALPEADAAATARYITEIRDRIRPLGEDTALIITADALDGVEPPAVLVADRWGEIAYMSRSSRVTDLPSPEDLVEWVEHVRQRCPECEGESR